MTATGDRRTRRFWLALGAIVLVGLGLRTAYVLTVARYDQHFYDASFYSAEAQSVANGHGFVEPFARFTHPGEPAPEAADHPPLTVLVLVPGALIDGELFMRFEMVVLGLGVVVAIGLLGRRLGGDAVGLTAAAIAAIYPNLWMNDALLMSETLATLTTVGAVLLTYRLLETRSVRVAVALGAVIGLAGLTRAELVLLFPLLLGPALWSLRAASRDAWRVGGAALAASLVLIMPWVGFNLARFDKPTFLSTGDGVALLGANCSYTYAGSWIGTWRPQCLRAEQPPGDQSVVARKYRSDAIDYATDHVGRWPAVIGARLGRGLSVFRLSQTADFSAGEGRPEWASYWGAAMFWIVALLAIAGVTTLRRRRVRMWPVLVPIAIALFTLIAFYGLVRFRAPAEPSFVVLAAVALVALVDRGRRGERREVAAPSAPVGESEPQPSTIEASSSS